MQGIYGNTLGNLEGASVETINTLIDRHRSLQYQHKMKLAKGQELSPEKEAALLPQIQQGVTKDMLSFIRQMKKEV